MKDIQLTPHFKLSELVKSSTATARHIDNTPNDEQIKNLKALCENVLEPLRQYFNCPVVIGSGFRCPKLNVAVGGAKNSQHTLGEAADIVPLPPAGSPYTINHTPYTLKEWFSFLEHNVDFDQLILETANGRDYWIHISCKKNRSKNRHQVIRELRKKSSLA